MSRFIRQPGEVTETADAFYGLRPARVRWRDRHGYLHQVEIAAAEERTTEVLPWWEYGGPLREAYGWRLQIQPFGRIYVYENTWLPKGDPNRWLVYRIED